VVWIVGEDCGGCGESWGLVVESGGVCGQLKGLGWCVWSMGRLDQEYRVGVVEREEQVLCWCCRRIQAWAPLREGTEVGLVVVDQVCGELWCATWVEATHFFAKRRKGGCGGECCCSGVDVKDFAELMGEVLT
jgi:hypothetical protein